MEKQLMPKVPAEGTQIQIDMKLAKPLTCKKCGKDIVQQVFKVLKVSALGNSTGQDLFTPQQWWRCVSCKKVWKEEFI